MKFTKWFPADAKPARPGVYQVRPTTPPAAWGLPWMSLWKDGHWHGTATGKGKGAAAGAKKFGLHWGVSHSDGELEWRGLASKDGK